METLIIRLKLAFEKCGIPTKGYPFDKLSEADLEREAKHWESRAANKSTPAPKRFDLDIRQPGQGPVFFHSGGGNRVIRKPRSES